MRKETLIQLIFLISVIALTSVFRGWLSLSYWPFWVGGIIGAILPVVDHLVNVLYLKPLDLSSQRVKYFIDLKQYSKALTMLRETEGERTGLILHTFYFQLIFVALAFLVITSSGSFLGRGIVLAFWLHLLLDQLFTFREKLSLDSWFAQMPFVMDKAKTTYYLIGNFVLFLLFTFLL
jgi:hypothetical protein